MKAQLVLGFMLCFTFSVFCLAQDAVPAPSPAPSPRSKPVLSKKQIERQLIKYENELWEAWKTRNAKVFRNRLTADGLNVGAEGVNSNADVIKAIAAEDCSVKSYKLSDFKTVMLNGSTAVLTYKGTQDGTCGGTTLPPVVWGSSTFVRRNGKWLAAIHQETPGK
jgi:hypothetical protein